MRRPLVWLCLVAAGCGLRTPVDAGNTGGGAGGSSANGGGSATLRYETLTLTGTGDGPVLGISGRAGEIYVTAPPSRLMRSTGAAFTEVTGTNLYAPAGVYVASDGSVFPIGLRQLGVCRTNCSAGSSYSFVSLGTNDAKAVCGDSPTNVYAAVEGTDNSAQLWRYDGVDWSSVANNLGVKFPRGCTLMPDHSVAVAAVSEVVFFLNGVITHELAATVPPLTQPEADLQQWNGLALAGSRLFAVGHARRISLRKGPDMWALTTFGAATDTLYAVGGPAENEVFAGGEYAGTTGLRFFDGSSWSDAPRLPTVRNVRAIYVATTGEVYFAGSDDNYLPAVDKAFR